MIVGARGVSGSFPATRPVACGTALATAFDEDPRPTPNDVFVICEDALSGGALNPRDLGVLATNATASGGPAALVSLPFTLRYAGSATAAANFALTATSTLPGATLAVTPGGLAPASNSDSQALVAVGIPAGAKAGTYDVTLTAKLATGQSRSRTGKLTVTGGGGGGGTTGGGTTAKLKLTTFLPKGLSAATARESGIAVLIGATKKATARVKLFQGSGPEEPEAEGQQARAPEGARTRAGDPEEREASRGPLPRRHPRRRAQLREVRESDAVGEVRAPHRGARNPPRHALCGGPSVQTIGQVTAPAAP